MHSPQAGEPSVEQIVFYVFAGVAVGSALLVILQQRAVYSAFSLIVCFGALAVLFFQLGAALVAALQVIVYAGAIMVLFLFVIMLLDPESERFGPDRFRKTALAALPAAAFLGFVLLRVFPAWIPSGSGDGLGSGEGPKRIAQILFRDYLLPFEVTSILILVAILGAVVLVKHRPD